VTVLVSLGWPPPARAKIADPRFCTVPMILLGSTSGAALPSCTADFGTPPVRTTGFRLVIRDINGAPLWNEPVRLDFSATSILLLADDRPGVTVDCAARTISAWTDQFGVVEFNPRFCGSSGDTRVIVNVDGVYVREVEARSTDVDGDGTTGIADFARVARNFLEGTVDSATDFDLCGSDAPGVTSLADFAIFAQELAREASAQLCP
jgi:hypothetical protein